MVLQIFGVLECCCHCVGLRWRGDGVEVVPAFVGIFGGMVQGSMMVAVGLALNTTIFGGSVFGPSLRACMVVAVGPSVITILDGGVF